MREATLAHPRNYLKQSAEADANGPMHTMMKKCRRDFFLHARAHPQWPAVTNAVVEYLGQRGPWLDGLLLARAEMLSPEAFWEETAATLNVPELKDFMLDMLTHVVDSADSERLWTLFQACDPKGSKRSRLLFATKEQEVGIAANLKLKRYLARPRASRRRMLRKTESKPEPTMYALADAPSDGELEEAEVDGDPKEESEAVEDVSEVESEGDGDAEGGAPSGSDELEGGAAPSDLCKSAQVNVARIKAEEIC